MCASNARIRSDERPTSTTTPGQYKHTLGRSGSKILSRLSRTVPMPTLVSVWSMRHTISSLTRTRERTWGMGVSTTRHAPKSQTKVGCSPSVPPPPSSFSSLSTRGSLTPRVTSHTPSPNRFRSPLLRARCIGVTSPGGGGGGGGNKKPGAHGRGGAPGYVCIYWVMGNGDVSQ